MSKRNILQLQNCPKNRFPGSNSRMSFKKREKSWFYKEIGELNLIFFAQFGPNSIEARRKMVWNNDFRKI